MIVPSRMSFGSINLRHTVAALPAKVILSIRSGPL